MTVSWFDGVTLTVEAGLASNPSVAIGSTAWTDISAFVRSISCHRGRSSEFDTFQAGTLQIVLDNRDRRFDPNYAAGPYFGNLLPMRRIRFRTTRNAVTYDVWSGFIDDLPQQYDIGNTDATVTVSCTDATTVLSLTPLAESVHWYDVMNLAPLVWYRLGESAGTVALDSSGNGRDGVYIGGATFNSRTGLLRNSNDNAIGFGPGQYLQGPQPIPLAFPFTVECWFTISTPASSELVNLWQIGADPTALPGGGVYTIAALQYFQTGNRLRAMLSDGINFLATDVTTTVVGTTYHVVVVFPDGNTNPTMYVNASSVGSSAGSGSGFVIYGQNLYVGDVLATSLTATIDEFAIYSGSLSSGQVIVLYLSGTTPWINDDTGLRIGRYLDKASWPSADRSIDTGISTMQPVSLDSQNALALSQTAELSEQGQFYVGADGKIVFRNRHWRFENTSAITSQGTFGDAGGELKYSDIVTDGGAQFLTNHVRATRDGGSSVDVTDATSITKFYERLNDVSGLQNQSDLEVRDLANWRLGTRKNPIQRVTVLEVKPRVDPTTLFPQVLGRDIGHRLTVKRRPQNVGAVLTYSALIEGIEHNVTVDGDWVTRFYLSSVDSQAAIQPLILDDAVNGLLDLNVLAY